MSDRSSELLRQFVESRPQVKECLRLGLINHASLAREVKSSYRSGSLTGLEAASRRLQSRLKPDASLHSQWKKILQKVKITIATPVSVLYLKPRANSSALKIHQEIIEAAGCSQLMFGRNRTVLIVPAEELSKTRSLAIESKIDDCAELIIKADSKSSATPGLSAKLFGLLSIAEVNILETFTAGGERFLYLRDSQLSAALLALKGEYK